MSRSSPEDALDWQHHHGISYDFGRDGTPLLIFIILFARIGAE